MRGQTLVEVLVAMTVGVLVLTAITSSVLTSIVNSRAGSASVLATQYAQEGLEIARGYRNAASGVYCLDRGEAALSGIPEGTCTTPNITETNNSFIRTLTVLGNDASNDCGTGINKAIVTVRWTDSKCLNGSYCHKITLNSCANVIAAAGTITPTFTPTPTETPLTTTLADIDDQTVNSGSPDSVDTTTSRLYANTTKNFLIKFDTASLVNKTLVDATLKLTERIAGRSYVIREAANNWDEEYATWNNKPAYGSSFGIGTADALKIINLDVTDRLQGHLGYPVSFAGLPNPGGSQDWVEAREGGVAIEPKLIVRTTTGTHSLGVPTVGASAISTCVSCTSLVIPNVAVSGTSPILLVSTANVSSSVITGVTYGSAPMTRLAQNTTFSVDPQQTIWYLFSPSSGTANVTVTLSVAKATIASAVVVNNTAEEFPFLLVTQNNAGSGTSLTSNVVPGAASDLLIGVFGKQCTNTLPTMTNAAGQTEIKQATVVNGSTNIGLLWAYKQGNQSPQTFGMTNNCSYYSSNISFAIRGKIL